MWEVDFGILDGQLLLAVDQAAVHCEDLIMLSGLTIPLASIADFALEVLLVDGEGFDL
jgi:hypothetical protein